MRFNERRPLDADSDEASAKADYEAVLAGLYDQLLDVYRAVHPTDSNLPTFGYRIRELLILFATEVESGMKGILRANSYESQKAAHVSKPKYAKPKRWNARDYARLVDAILLDQWNTGLVRFEEPETRTPFEGWTSSSVPSWWTAYNRTKHDSEAHLADATLDAVIDAAAACFVLGNAAFGYREFMKDQRVFLPVRRGSARRIERIRLGNDWTPVNFQFDFSV